MVQSVCINYYSKFNDSCWFFVGGMLNQGKKMKGDGELTSLEFLRLFINKKSHNDLCISGVYKMVSVQK